MRSQGAAALGFAVAICACAPARAARFDIAPGTLGSVAAALGLQAGVTVGVTDAALAARPSPGVRGDLSLREALRRALRGTGADFALMDDTVRIAVAPVRTRTPRSVVAAPPDERDIVVTASKQATRRDRYPGSVEVLDLGSERLAVAATGDSAALVARLPVLASTSLGPGRDKLFIRGIADSSFNGPSQATIGQYFGEARLTYNAPDPNLNLYDMQRVEVLVGPQGTLYGSGALGGILRLIPNAPDASGIAATAAAGVSATRFGGTGGDVAASINLPVAQGRAAVRAVAYRRAEPGYIDDPVRGRDGNRTSTTGGRLMLRVEDFAGWTVDAVGLLQNIASRDGQYTLRGEPALTRRTAIAQPFDSDFRLATLTVQRSFDHAAIISTTSLVRHDVASIFDAGDGRRFDEDIGITLVSHETRIAGGSVAAPWLGGISAVYDLSRLTRRLGIPAAPQPIAGLRNQNTEIAAFGRYGFPLIGTVSATVGGRVTWSRSIGGLLPEIGDDTIEPRRTETRLSPTLALAWQATPLLFAFAHYQEGFRAGGIAATPSGAATDNRRFEPDTLTMVEVGVRRGRLGTDALTFEATLSRVGWSRIQADLVDAEGLPFTANIGDGRILGFEAKIDWRPSAALSFAATTFFNRSALYAPAPGFEAADERSLPNIAEAGGRVAATWRVAVAEGVALVLDGSLRYLSTSELGIGASLDAKQGNYFVGAVGGRLAFGRYAVSLDVANVADARANRFAFGNPFGVAEDNQITPLRPRSIRIGLDARF